MLQQRQGLSTGLASPVSQPCVCFIADVASRPARPALASRGEPQQESDRAVRACSLASVCRRESAGVRCTTETQQLTRLSHLVEFGQVGPGKKESHSGENERLCVACFKHWQGFVSAARISPSSSLPLSSVLARKGRPSPPDVGSALLYKCLECGAWISGASTRELWRRVRCSAAGVLPTAAFSR